MAFPTVETTATSEETTQVDVHTVSLPASIAAGDVLLIFASIAIATRTITSNPAGFTKLFDDTEGSTFGSDTRLVVWYKKATGSEGATEGFGTDFDTTSAHISYRISGAEDPATQAPEAAAKADGTTALDPPSLTPTGGAKDYLWIGAGSEGETAGQSITGAPANYTNLLGTNSAAGAEIATAQRQLNASSEDPGAFGDDGDTLRWVATTVAIHPAAGGGISVPLGTVSFALDMGTSLGVRHTLSPVTFDLSPQALTPSVGGIDVPLGVVAFNLAPQELSPPGDVALGVVSFNLGLQDISPARSPDLGVVSFGLAPQGLTPFVGGIPVPIGVVAFNLNIIALSTTSPGEGGSGLGHLDGITNITGIT